MQRGPVPLWAMPKPLKKKPAGEKSTTPKRPSSDPNRRAGQLLTEHLNRLETSEKPWDVAQPATVAQSFQEQLSAHMAKLGAKGGKISGAKRMEMPVAERRRIASLAARAMWAKRKGGKKR